MGRVELGEGLSFPRQNAVIQMGPCVRINRLGQMVSTNLERPGEKGQGVVYNPVLRGLKQTGLKTAGERRSRLTGYLSSDPPLANQGTAGCSQSSMGSNLLAGFPNGSCFSFEGFPGPGYETDQDEGQEEQIPWTHLQLAQALPGSRWLVVWKVIEPSKI